MPVALDIRGQLEPEAKAPCPTTAWPPPADSCLTHTPADRRQYTHRMRALILLLALALPSVASAADIQAGLMRPSTLVCVVDASGQATMVPPARACVEGVVLATAEQNTACKEACAGCAVEARLLSCEGTPAISAGDMRDTYWLLCVGFALGIIVVLCIRGFWNVVNGRGQGD